MRQSMTTAGPCRPGKEFFTFRAHPDLERLASAPRSNVNTINIRDVVT